MCEISRNSVSISGILKHFKNEKSGEDFENEELVGNDS
jgi:hypothetical protein